MAFLVAIPSYKRSLTLLNKTLRVLAHKNIDLATVSVYVANIDEYHTYKEVLKGLDVRIELGKLGMKGILNHIIKSYMPGERVMFIDDDIEEIYVRINDKQLAPLDNLNEFIESSFELCDVEGAKLWGIYPVRNPFFMKDTVTTDLRHIVGSFCGRIIEHDEDLFVSVESKTDYEQSIKHYLKYGKVIRFNFVTLKTKFYSEPGGMQAQFNLEDRVTSSEKSVKYLQKKYPQFVTLTKHKNKPYQELRLKDRRN